MDGQGTHASPAATLGRKQTLDKDLEKINLVEDASRHLGRRLAAPGAALLFIVGVVLVALATLSGHPSSLIAVTAAVLAAYMAMNIGANDVANNIGAAVGARALSLGMGLAIAAFCEIAGALIAGNKVAGTIANGIIHTEMLASPEHLALAMMAALLAAAAWINIATWIGAPVSTTHAIVGGVLGAGIAAAGFNAVQWQVVGAIAISWLLSPLLGAMVAIAVLAFINSFIIYVPDKLAAARRWVPVLMGLMFGAFTTYMVLVLPDDIIMMTRLNASLAGLVTGIGVWFVSRPLIARKSAGLENRERSLRVLFQFPLVISAALLSFAHGTNDVANAIGPLAAVVAALQQGPVVGQSHIPFWELAIGGAGISIGLLLFGPRLVNLVGKGITKLNPIRAYCVALSAAMTVILASSIGAPVSSTHIAIGAVFGVGLFREWYNRHSSRRQRYLAMRAEEQAVSAKPRPRHKDVNIDEVKRRYLVRRSHLLTIIAAWTVTVPLSAALAAGVTMIMFRLFA
ncbi:inorganic phosphate transporter [Rhizobium helianthi]|uniref:Phosphate transporter n=1 Tax=Rhizobium helianthi TaxID=1132695 RepID=A0ABW4M3B1_9HYPH